MTLLNSTHAGASCFGLYDKLFFKSDNDNIGAFVIANLMASKALWALSFHWK